MRRVAPVALSNGETSPNHDWLFVHAARNFQTARSPSRIILSGILRNSQTSRFSNASLKQQQSYAIIRDDIPLNTETRQICELADHIGCLARYGSGIARTG
eukprot:IDg7775t1